ncbi:MAG: ribosome maturation factor RimP [Alphaproteobacteria bacterium]|nr:MAG: ribosome maturation factor RimP [Alphaproteobacteria bacterium]
MVEIADTPSLRATGLAQKVEALLAPSVESMGYAIVRVLLMGQRRMTLQIMVERLDQAPLSVEDCADVSRAVSALLDVHDPIKSEYVLEVSSPGIDRPLTRPAHFERFRGFEARLETDRMIDERKRFKGRLDGLDADGRVRLIEGETVWLVPLRAVAKAKLILTDELLATSPDRPRQ